MGQEWRPFGTPKKIRPFSSVVLAETIAEDLKRDVEHFLTYVSSVLIMIALHAYSAAGRMFLFTWRLFLGSSLPYALMQIRSLVF